MTEINLLLEFADDGAPEQTAQTVQERLSRIELIEAVDAIAETPGQMRDVGAVDVAAAIGVTMIVVRSTRELVEELRTLMPPLKALLLDIRGLKKVFVEVGSERVPVDELRPEHYEKLAKGV